MAATTKGVAAVATPRLESPCRMLAPAPRKPIPVAICAAIRVGSVRTRPPPCRRKSRNPYAEAIVKRAEPSETSMCVRKPASRSRNSRSRPTAPPSAAARARRSSASSHESDGTLDASSIEGLLLGLADLLDPGRSQVEKLLELGPVERRAFGRRLHLDEPARTGHDHVQVDLGARVFLVVEVEQPLAADDPGRDRRDR